MRSFATAAFLAATLTLSFVFTPAPGHAASVDPIGPVDGPFGTQALVLFERGFGGGVVKVPIAQDPDNGGTPLNMFRTVDNGLATASVSDSATVNSSIGNQPIVGTGQGSASASLSSGALRMIGTGSGDVGTFVGASLTDTMLYSTGGPANFTAVVHGVVTNGVDVLSSAQLYLSLENAVTGAVLYRLGLPRKVRPSGS